LKMDIHHKTFYHKVSEEIMKTVELKKALESFAAGTDPDRVINMVRARIKIDVRKGKKDSHGNPQKKKQKASTD